MTDARVAGISEEVFKKSVRRSITLTFRGADVAQDHSVTIGKCAYGRYPGIFVYKVYGQFNAVGMRRDGTWFKYGESFETHDQAYEALIKTPYTSWGEEKHFEKYLERTGV